MTSLTIKTTEKTGVIKPMHAVNNGPVHSFAQDQRISNLESYKAAGIPYARNHDAAFYEKYGGEHIVDVHAIFPDFSKDPYNEDSYDFIMTDEYLRVIDCAGTKTFYRLGAKIEHGVKKYGTLPPKDFHKWAIICEHIIKHYTQGWSKGFHYDIEYWEIWNEPDLDSDDSNNKRTWGGTKLQFFDMYEIAAKHLKNKFPELKIGGPALAYDEKWADEFLNEMKKRNAPLDFFSWHIYCTDPKYIIEKAVRMKEMLLKYNFQNTESILNEWNYVKSFQGDEWIYSLKQEKSLKGAAFIASAMCSCQYAPLDMLMYYDARPCGMNGMYDTDFPNECLKGYYPFKAFNELYKLKNCVAVECDNQNIRACAAISEDCSQLSVMLSHFNDDDNTPTEKVSISLTDLDSSHRAEILCLDESHNLEVIQDKVIEGNTITIELPIYTTCLINVK